MFESIAEQIWLRFPEGGSPLVLMLALGRVAAHDGTCEISMAQLETAGRMSRTSVWRTLAELRRAGWIVADRLPGRAAAYRVQLALGDIGLAPPAVPVDTDEEAGIAGVPICNAMDAYEKAGEAGSTPDPTTVATCAEEPEISCGRSTHAMLRHPWSSKQRIGFVAK